MKSCLFLDDLQARLASRIQLTTDGPRLYIDTVAGAFGGDVDYVMLVKLYGEDANQTDPEKKHSPGVFRGALKRRVTATRPSNPTQRMSQQATPSGTN